MLICILSLHHGVAPDGPSYVVIQTIRQYSPNYWGTTVTSRYKNFYCQTWPGTGHQPAVSAEEVSHNMVCHYGKVSNWKQRVFYMFLTLSAHRAARCCPWIKCRWGLSDFILKTKIVTCFVTSNFHQTRQDTKRSFLYMINNYIILRIYIYRVTPQLNSRKEVK